jgi:four helix bundle protein
MHPFRRLSVWEKAHELVLIAYPITEGPMHRRFPGLSSQLRRSLAAIPANIAEGAGHESQAQFNRYLTIALASAREAEYHLLLAKDLGAIALKQYAVLEARLGAVTGMLYKLRSRITQNLQPRPVARRSRSPERS